MAQNPENIKGLAFDIDGVMTDGSLIALPDGDLLRTYNAKDTFAVRVAALSGIKIGVLTGGLSQATLKRFTGLGVDADDIHMACRGKMKDFKEFCDKYGLRPDEVAYVGDDIPDVPVLQACGLGIAPSDAVPEAREAADIVSSRPGGKGCMREVVEMILKARGAWSFDNFENIF